MVPEIVLGVDYLERGERRKNGVASVGLVLGDRGCCCLSTLHPVTNTLFLLVFLKSRSEHHRLKQGTVDPEQGTTDPKQSTTDLVQAVAGGHAPPAGEYSLFFGNKGAATLRRTKVCLLLLTVASKNKERNPRRD